MTVRFVGGGAPGPSGGRARRPRGQATVELALVLPVVVVVLLLVVQVSLVGLAQVLVGHAARAGARTAAVEASTAAIRAAAADTPGLRADRTRVLVGPRGAPGSLVSVTVRYRVPTEVPLVGRLVGDPTVEATVRMQVEVDGAASTRR